MEELDWSKLGFGYRPTSYNVRCYYRDGKWGEIEVCSDEYIKLHMAIVVPTERCAFSALRRMLRACNGRQMPR